MAIIRIYFESMAGTHLLDSIDALRDAGSADALYNPEWRTTAPSERAYDDDEVARQEAVGRQMAYSRRALLFAAFAVEAYINDYLYDHVQDANDRRTLVMLSPVEKYILLPRMLGGEELFSRNKAPWTILRWLFKRRDELVHAKPSGRWMLAGEDPEIYNPRKAAEAIAAAAESAVRLEGDRDSTSVAAIVHAERAAFLNFGKATAAVLPSPDDSPAPFDLVADARKRRGRSQIDP